MKHLFRSLCRFGLVVLILCIPVCIVYRKALRSSFKEKVFEFNNKQIHVLTLGDSHPEWSINDENWDDMFKSAQRAEWLNYDYIKLQLLSERCPDLQVVILGLSYHSFTHEPASPSDAHFDICFHLYPFIQDANISFDNPLALTLWEAKLNYSCGLVTKHSIPKIRKAIPKVKNVIFGETLLNSTSIPQIIAPVPIRWEPRIHEHYYHPATHELKAPSYAAMAELHKIRDFCLQRGYKLVLFNAPVSRGYFAHIPPVYKNLTDSVACALSDNRNVYYINYSRYPLPDSCFRDGDHTNLYGANIITPLLRDSLLARGILQPQREP